MHRETTHTSRRSRSVVVILLALAIVAVFGMAAQQALALPTFTDAVGGIGPCATCHAKATTHANANHAALACTSCHATADGATPPLPTACAKCHGGASAILFTTAHASKGCGTTPGCHGVPAGVTPTIAIDTVAPKSVKLKASVTLSGGVTPIDTAAKDVGWAVQFKKGSKWVPVKAGTATLGFLGGAMRFSFTYKPTKVGSYRASASFYNLIGGSKTTSKLVLFKAVK